MSDLKTVKKFLSRLDRRSLVTLAREFSVSSRNKTKSQLIDSLLHPQQRGSGIDDELIRDYLDNAIDIYVNDVGDENLIETWVAGVELKNNDADIRVDSIDFSQIDKDPESEIPELEISDYLDLEIKKELKDPYTEGIQLSIRVNPAWRRDTDDIWGGDPGFEVVLESLRNEDEVIEQFSEIFTTEQTFELIRLLMRNGIHMYDVNEEPIAHLNPAGTETFKRNLDDDDDDDEDEDMEQLTQQAKRIKM